MLGQAAKTKPSPGAECHKANNQLMLLQLLVSENIPYQFARRTQTSSTAVVRKYSHSTPGRLTPLSPAINQPQHVLLQ
jgi:hypothetical protein